MPRALSTLEKRHPKLRSQRCAQWKSFAAECNSNTRPARAARPPIWITLQSRDAQELQRGAVVSTTCTPPSPINAIYSRAQMDTYALLRRFGSHNSGGARALPRLSRVDMKASNEGRTCTGDMSHARNEFREQPLFASLRACAHLYSYTRASVKRADGSRARESSGGLHNQAACANLK